MNRPKNHRDQAPRGGSVKIYKITAQLREGLKRKIVKRLGIDSNSAAHATYIPTFEGGDTMEVRIIPNWELSLKNNLTVCKVDASYLPGLTIR